MLEIKPTILLFFEVHWCNLGPTLRLGKPDGGATRLTVSFRSLILRLAAPIRRAEVFPR